MKIERLVSPNRIAGRGGRRPSWIVVHTTVGSFRSAQWWFADPDGKVSAHYLVGLDGRVASFVDEQDGALHAGRVESPTADLAIRAQAEGDDPNLTTVGIELVDDGDPLAVDRTDAQYAATARLVAMAAERWAIPIDAEHVVGHREIRADKTCPGNVDLERVRREARAWLDAAPAGRQLIVGLLPARNAAPYLPRWLETAPTWCDTVVALDDGSTDETRAMLEAAPNVTTVLRHRRRSSAAGWHDGRNRQELLEAAGGLVPDWIVQIDADEVLEGEDADALRAFLMTEAVPGLAFGLRHCRMWGERVDAVPRWVYRAFAWEPGQRMPDRALHFNPIPIDIPRAAWVRTTIRVRHLGGLDAAALEDRRRKYVEASPQDATSAAVGGLDEVPSLTVPWVPRPAGASVLLAADEDLGDLEEDLGRPLLAVLLPVRNGGVDLPGWFEGVRGLADVVVALDDGSTDETRALLEAAPVVGDVLVNPPRPTAAGWDDAANRQALLDAVAPRRPRWILFLDADERIDAADASALRSFLASDDAERGAAYGFRVHRMINDDAYDRADLWVYRLFAWRPGLLLPGERLHLVPVPVTVPPGDWIPTTVRIRHLGGGTPERREARRRKYAEADPDREHQADYEELMAAGGPAIAWEPRPEDLPVIAADRRARRKAADEDDLSAPVLSAIVIARDDAERIERVVRSVVAQDCPEPFEVIVVVSGSRRTAQVVRSKFPQVTMVERAERLLPGAARNAGLALARGDYVSFPGSHIELPQGSLAARLQAHERGYPMVTGSMLNGTRTRAGWANYFLDHSGSLPGRRTEALMGPPAHCSYDREILQGIGGFREDLRAGEDTAVNVALTRAGYATLRAADVVLIHESPCRTVRHLLVHHLQRGRAFGSLLRDGTPPGQRVLSWDVLRRHLFGYLPRRIRGTAADVAAWGGPGLGEAYRSVRPLVILGAVSAWVGLWFELLRPGAR